ncbi:MAG: hypothetical protein J7604_01790 [Sporocytophaga sp.]|uniref:hypothetical protein n=1 Tax=Sporocytophaga sp. TaxID=2231183 RepID=UPI001B25505A|nr:hypothetical protein [Sporocytophaga sp.]MBO9698906.1 hypothetical protein [Sporocytophaga sp.]
MLDFKKLTEELFEKDVLLCIRTNSPTFRMYGKQIRGKLESIYTGTKKVLTILSNSLTREVPIDDIDFISEDKYV